MKVSTLKWPAALTRRRTLLLGGAGAATLAVAIAVAPKGGSAGILLAGVSLEDLKDLGDGFYEADGWVLTADDVRRLGGRLPAQRAD